MIRAVKWKEQMDQWHQNPDKLLAWITKLFYDAQIPLDDNVSWLAKDGKIIINPELPGRLLNKK